MIWLTWRQHRREALVFAALLVAFAIYLILLGRAMYDDYYHVTGGASVAACIHRNISARCNPLVDAFYGGRYSINTSPRCWDCSSCRHCWACS